MSLQTLPTLTFVFTLGLVSLACSPQTNSSPDRSDLDVWFEDQSSQRGVDFLHQSGARGDYWLPEITGGGVALLDVENDGDLDIYFIQSGHLQEPVDVQPSNVLFLNDGIGNFTAADSTRGLDDQKYGMGVATGDYDGDGDVDIFVTNLGRNSLYQNDSSGTFKDVTNEAGLANENWSTAASFADFDLDGNLDLFVANYLHWNPATELDCHTTHIRSYCVPLHNYAAMDRLYRNNGDGTFKDVTFSAGLARAFGNGLGSVVVDVNEDGLLDIFVANDAMVNQLWINQGDFTFVNDAWFLGVAMDDHGIEKAGMGVVTLDHDDDGDFDLLVVNIQGQTDSFFRNEGSHFLDATGSVGLGIHSRRFTRFGLVAADFNNDGCVDLYQANGSVYHNEEDFHKPDFFQEPNTLYRGTCGNRFELVQPEGSTLPVIEKTSRALAVGDLNADGYLDLVAVNRDAQASVLMNVRSQQGETNFVRFSVVDELGRHAYNSKLTARIGERTVTRRVQTDGGYLSAHEPDVHLGLGRATVVDEVMVTWANGETQSFGSFKAGTRNTLAKVSGSIH